MNFEIASYEACRDELLAFRNANRTDPVDAAYTDWRYLQRPNSGSGVIVWARNANGERVGMVSHLPVRYTIRGKEAVFSSIGDLSVREDHRGKGLGVALLRQIGELDDAMHFQVAVAITKPEVKSVFERAGYHKASEWRRYVRVIGTLQDMEFSTRFSSWVRSLAGFILTRAGSMTQSDITKWDVEEVRHFDDRFDTHWSSIDKRTLVMAVRDRAYLRWRFELHPSKRYRILAVGTGGRPSGYLVYGLREGSCAVVDLLFDNDQALRALLKSLVHRMREEMSVYRITLALGANDGGGMLLSSGFLGRPDRQPLVCWTQPGRDISLHKLPWYLTAADKDI